MLGPYVKIRSCNWRPKTVICAWAQVPWYHQSAHYAKSGWKYGQVPMSGSSCRWWQLPDNSSNLTKIDEKMKSVCLKERNQKQGKKEKWKSNEFKDGEKVLFCQAARHCTVSLKKRKCQIDNNHQSLMIDCRHGNGLSYCSIREHHIRLSLRSIHPLFRF